FMATINCLSASHTTWDRLRGTTALRRSDTYLSRRNPRPLDCEMAVRKYSASKSVKRSRTASLYFGAQNRARILRNQAKTSFFCFFPNQLQTASSTITVVSRFDLGQCEAALHRAFRKRLLRRLRNKILERLLGAPDIFPPQ